MKDRENGTNNCNSGQEMHDENLMCAVAGGSMDSFTVLVRKYHVALLNFFRRMNVYSGDRDDLVQETFIRLYNYRQKYKPAARFKTFLYLLARQVQIDYYRQQQRRFALAETLRNGPEEVSIGCARHNFVEDAKERVEKALNTLSEEMRCVVVMSIYQELKYAEIAEILDIPVGTVKTRMFHALQKLGKVIEHE
jgi:RNA polymerase sigma factor (sigma-70 family)